MNFKIIRPNAWIVAAFCLLLPALTACSAVGGGGGVFVPGAGGGSGGISNPLGSNLDGGGHVLTNFANLVPPYGTNLLQRAFVLTNADNGVLIASPNSSQWFTTNASYTVTGFSGLVAGVTANPDITVSNSSGSDIIVTQPAGTIFWLGSTNRVKAGGQLNFGYQIKLGSVTNLLTAGTP